MRTRPLPPKKAGAKSAQLRLQKGDLEKVTQAGKLTFRPITGGKFRCNQLPHHGALSRSQVAALRDACAFKGSKTDPQQVKVVRPSRNIFYSAPSRYASFGRGLFG